MRTNKYALVSIATVGCALAQAPPLYLQHRIPPLYFQENKPLLAFALEALLKMAHPFAPFVTETIWQTLAWEPDTLLAAAEWPRFPEMKTTQAKAFEAVKTIVAEARTIMTAVGVTKTDMVYSASPLVEANKALIARLAHLGAVEAAAGALQGVKLTQTTHDIRLAISDDVAQRYAAKLAERQAAEVEAIKRLEGRLSNKSYVDHAPKDVVEQTRAQLAESTARLESLKQEAARFKTV